MSLPLESETNLVAFSFKNENFLICRNILNFVATFFIWDNSYFNIETRMKHLYVYTIKKLYLFYLIKQFLYKNLHIKLNKENY